MKLPTFYLTHGGGPFPVLAPEQQGPGGRELTTFMENLSSVVKVKPKAIVVISAHFAEDDAIGITSSESPQLLYDYYGFPREAYALKYPAKGDPMLAKRIADLLQTKGIKSKLDTKARWDHGVFIPLLLAYPEADIPVVSVSLHNSLDPALHFSMGEALQPLREEGVLILASGSSFHNMREFQFREVPDSSLKGKNFDEDMRRACLLNDVMKRRDTLVGWEKFREARYAHPTEEHFIPLLVAAGAAGSDPAEIAHSSRFAGSKISSIIFGKI